MKKKYIIPKTELVRQTVEFQLLAGTVEDDGNLYGAKKNFSDFESSDGTESQWPKQKSLWDD